MGNITGKSTIPSCQARLQSPANLAAQLFVTDADPELEKLVPSMCFLIQHTRPGDSRPERIVFDLGIKRDMDQYASGMQGHLSKRQPIVNLPDTKASLEGGGLDPTKDIDYVILSHTHWDHIGLPSDYPNAKFVVGSGTLHTVINGAPHYPAEMFVSLSTTSEHSEIC
jgi:glyoxylase-like metal-dependent hydrolase (beta-lactamase superfamily II)